MVLAAVTLPLQAPAAVILLPVVEADDALVWRDPSPCLSKACLCETKAWARPVFVRSTCHFVSKFKGGTLSNLDAAGIEQADCICSILWRRNWVSFF